MNLGDGNTYHTAGVSRRQVKNVTNYSTFWNLVTAKMYTYEQSHSSPTIGLVEIWDLKEKKSSILVAQPALHIM